MTQWEILVFKKSDEAHASTITNIRLTLNVAQKIFSISSNNPMYDSYPIGPEEAAHLKQFCKIDFDFEAYDYFLERRPLSQR